jgi:formyltetrahydrofolate deformylase
LEYLVSSPHPRNSFVLTLACQDRQGIVYAVSAFLRERQANIVEAAQFADDECGRLFMRFLFRVELECQVEVDELRALFAPVANEHAMVWSIQDASRPMPAILMVSKLGHCLHDLLLRWRTGLLPVRITSIVSNHADFRDLATSYGLAFHHLPVTPETKQHAEARLLEVIAAERAEVVVLARYMQVLSDEFTRQLPGRIINIHHSFLPGFKGGRPYHQAHRRGVKLIGATSHYVTADLDEGPIIEQDVVRIDHGMGPAALASMGRDVESVVLARALKWHAEHRVLLNGERTVVFR